MDKIGSHQPLISTGTPVEKKLHVEPKEKDLKPKVQPELKDPVDSVETTRQERIQMFMDRSVMNISEFVELGTAGFVGQIVGSAVAFATIGGVLPVAIGGGIGVAGGLLLHHLGWDKKVFKGVKTAIGVTLIPFVLAAKGMKKGIGKLIDLLKPSKKKEDKQASGSGKAVSGDAKSASGTGGTVVRDAGTGEGLIAEKGAAKTVKQEEEKDIKRGILSTIGKGFGTAAKALRAIPKFIYPSIQNATAAEEALITETLDSLPLKTVTSTSTITIDPNLAKDMGAAGMARDLFFDRPIVLDRGHMAMEAMDLNKGVIIHELGHTADYASTPIPRVGRSSFAPFGEGPYVFDPTIDTPGDLYASTNHWEDFAQSEKFYQLDPEKLKATSMEKFEALEKFHEPGLKDKIMDRPSIRELGKKISKAIDKVPHLRTTLSVIGKIMGPIEMNIGADKIEHGIKEADLTKKYQGKMAMAQGIAFSSKVLAPIGLGITIAKLIVDRKLKKGKWSIKQANEFSNKALATITGPLGMIYHAAAKEMLKTPEGQEHDDFTYQERKSEGLKEKITGQFGIRQFTAQEVDSKRKLPTEEANLTKDDKIFMAKVGGGAVLGGVAGTVAGFMGGAFVGAAVGGLIGGPFGSLLGGLIGKVAGTMFLSYKGAKAGAKLGRLLDKESRDVKVKIVKEKVVEGTKKALAGMNIAPKAKNPA